MVWRTLFLVPAYLLTSAMPLVVPAFANLEYEYALAASYLALILIPLAGLILPAKHLPMINGAYHIDIGRELAWVCLASPLVGLASGAFMFAAGQCACSRTGFAFWMVLVWYPAWVLAHAAYHAILRARVHGLPRAKLAAAVTLTYAALTYWVALTLWVTPQKRVLSLVLGFLHGPIYDDWIAVDGGILLGRAAHLALALVFLLAAWWQRRRWQTVATFCVAAVWLTTGLLAGQYQSTRNGKDALDAILSGKLEGEGFTLRYRQSEARAATPASVQRLFRDAQFHIKELKDLLGETTVPHVDIYVYPNDDRKKLWFGGGATDVTDVFTPSVHVSLGAWPHPTLRHELAHALTSGFAYHGLGFHPNMAFTEGLAVALAPEPRSLSLDDGTAAMIKDDRLPPVETLFTPLFWKVSGGRAYTAAGSLIRYLIDRHGIKGVKALYGGASWNDAFGKDRDALVAAWREHILKGYDPETNALFAEALFRKPGVLDERCPHTVADYARSRDDAFVRMRQPVGWDPDGDFLEWHASLDPKNESARLKVWRREIRKVAQDRFAAPGRLITWRETLARARATPPKSLEDIEMALLESDLARVLGDVDASLQILVDLGQESRMRFLGDSLTREIETRWRLEQTQVAGPQTIEWRRYLAGFRKALPDATAADGSWLLTYLKVRNTKDLDRDALRRLLAEMIPDADLPSTFALEWYRLIAERSMRLGDYVTASGAYERAAQVARPASQELYKEHGRRARFYAAAGPLAAPGDDSRASR